ncbi:hypothetical protein PV325_002945 [Microctonus aethiopoides]|nr:hypothetical protein PV325_002945 [Microctonus aethiopoides]
MNKTEKLLAARKKLKEFQLHKSNHDQEVTANQPNNHHQHEKVVFHQEDNNFTPDNSILNNNDKNRNIEKSNEHSQIHFDFNNSDNASNNVTQNSNPTESFAHSNEEDTKIAIKNDEINRQIAESFDINTSEERILQSNYAHVKQEWLPHEMQIKMFETMKMAQTNNDTDNSKSFEMEPSFGNNADLSNSTTNITENSSHVASIMNTNSIDNKNDCDDNRMKSENKSLLLNLEMEKNKVHQLEIQVNESHNKISELESLLAQKNTEHSNEFLHKINSLNEEIQMHRQAAEILVAEKADLSAALLEYQTVAQHKSEEVSELYGKLKHTMARMTDMEKDLITLKANTEDDKLSKEKLINDYTKLEEQYTELKKVGEEQQLETAELRQDLNIKKSELINLQQKMEENKNLLSLAELKIQQLTNAPQQLQEIEHQHEAHASLKEQLLQLHESLKTITNEKEEMCKHYESYVKQLNAKYEGTVQELELAQKKIHEYGEREESLIQRLSLMEQHYQREKQKVDSLLPLKDHEEKISHLTKSMDSLVLENDNLQRALHEKEVKIESMKEELQELRELRDQSVETSKLVTALESEQLGASRAVSQNQQLKLQLNEMHDAFVMLSNSKLNLTEQLQDERAVGRKLNAEYSRIEAERDELKEELNRKSAIIEELEKDKLHFAQVADQMQHYQVQSTQARTLQQELQNAMSTIEKLKIENQSLNEKLNGSTEITNGINIDDKNLNDQIIDDKEIEIPTADIVTINKEEKVSEQLQQLQNNNSYVTLADNQKKLELRFKETMERVAELTDEKQRLEHLVLQLQGETETIGEYITLYQRQRAILQMKAQEKERTFNQLLDERNRQQAQLHQLKILVAELLKIDEHNSKTSVAHQSYALPDQFNSDEYPKDNQEVTENGIVKQTVEEPIKVDIANETTSKILELLTEIKDCKDTCSVEPNFHHCLWCSGKLITV